jgi:hypothetical protein
MNRQLSLFFILSILGCSQEVDTIKGHWHLVSPEYSFYKTLDISDSLTITEYYALDGNEYYEIPRRYESDNILPVDDYEYTTNFFVANDTLYIKKDSLIKNYVKSNIKDCILIHRYSNSFIDINLTIDNNALKFEHLPKTNCGTNVFVGKLRNDNSQFIDSLSISFPDSIFIQVNDIFIGLNDLTKFSIYTKDVCAPREPSIYLHIDNNVPAAFIDQILSNFPDTSNMNLNRIVETSDGDIGLIKL